MVDFGFEVEEIVEGKASILVPRTVRGRGPGKKEGIPFYNPVMEANRDISLLVLQNRLSNRKNRVLDGLAGTGIRGIRFALEVSGDLSILMNDWNEQSYALMLENIKRNGAQEVEARREDLNVLLVGEEFDYLDVDPYGTPVIFLDKAIKGVRDGGVLAVTATDTAALVGSSPRACMRKYDATPLKNKTSHETGLRILIGYCARIAIEHDLGIRPLLSHSTNHYYRTYLEIRHGQIPVDTTLEELGYLSKNQSTQEILLKREKKDDSKFAGPLWTGNLWNPSFLKEMKPRSYMRSETSRILELMKLESQIESPYYSSDEISSNMKVHTPRLTRIIEILREGGFEASPTHFDTKGFRTNAPINNILQVFKED